MSGTFGTRTRKVVAAGSGACLAASLLLVGGAQAQGADTAAATPNAASSGPLKPADGAFATSSVRTVTAVSTEGGKSFKAGSKRLKIKLLGVKSLVTTTAKSYTQVSTRVRQKYLDRLGKNSRGVVQVRKFNGNLKNRPVKFEQIKVVNAKKGKVLLKVKILRNQVPDLVSDRVPLVSLNGSSFSGKLQDASFTATPKSSQTFKWAGTTSGSSKSQMSVKAVGDSILVKARKPRYLVGAQPPGAAGMAPADLAKEWNDMTAGGVSPRLTVWGERKGKSNTKVYQSTIRVEHVSVNNRKIAFAGKMLPSRQKGGVKHRDIKDSMTTMGYTLETPSNGNNTGYTVITGDSIASGEGASFAGTYLNGKLMTTDGDFPAEPDDQKDRIKAFCETTDLACLSAKESGGKVDYVRDLGQVYEKGSYEDPKAACHRSLTAPGTWLARYHMLEEGMDADAIIIACSGAKADDVLKNSFKGQKPQVQDLKSLAKWLNVTEVVNTIGANDIHFGETAVDCMMAPVQILLPALLKKPFSISNLGAVMAGIMDNVYRKNGEIKTLNPYFDPGKELCSVKDGQRLIDDLAALPAKIAAVVNGIQGAAPGAKIVQTNYPNLVPASVNTNYPRQVIWDGPWATFVDSQYDQDTCDDLREQLIKDGTLPKGAPAADCDPSFTAGQKAGNTTNEAIATIQWSSASTQPPPPKYDGAAILPDQYTQSLLLGGTAVNEPQLLRVLNYGALMFGYDQDWVAQDAVLGLNKAVIAGVAQAKDGSKVTVVDMTQLFNGREMGGQYAMTDPNDQDESLINTAWATEGPDKVRGAFANSIMPGQTIATLCWDDTVLNGLAPGTGDCIGSTQEALHPNWRGQAAEGQCIVAVVTGAIPGTGNGGNSCVRSVGDGTVTPRYNTSSIPFFVATTSVPGGDTFCLMPSSTMDAVLKDEYTPCTGGDPDPTWDAKAWKRGEVSWQGNPTMWN